MHWMDICVSLYFTIIVLFSVGRRYIIMMEIGKENKKKKTNKWSVLKRRLK